MNLDGSPKHEVFHVFYHPTLFLEYLLVHRVAFMVSLEYPLRFEMMLARGGIFPAYFP